MRTRAAVLAAALMVATTGAAPRRATRANGRSQGLCVKFYILHFTFFYRKFTVKWLVILHFTSCHFTVKWFRHFACTTKIFPRLRRGNAREMR